LVGYEILMTLKELRFKLHSKIRRATWPDQTHLDVSGWEYGGLEWAYEPSAETPYGLLHSNDKVFPFHVTPGHKGTDWEIVE
jgi:hypothetical protein